MAPSSAFSHIGQSDSERHRDLFGREIVEIAQILGITDFEYESLTGPEVLLLAGNIKATITPTNGGLPAGRVGCD